MNVWHETPEDRALQEKLRSEAFNYLGILDRAMQRQLDLENRLRNLQYHFRDNPHSKRVEETFQRRIDEATNRVDRRCAVQAAIDFYMTHIRDYPIQ